MRRPIQFLLAGTFVLLFGITGAVFQMYRRAQLSERTSDAREQTARLEYQKALTAISAIRDSLDAVSRETPAMGVRAEGLESASRSMEQRRREALARIAAIGERIQRNKARILQLEDDLRRGGARSAGMERTIGSLRRSVAREEAASARLTERVAAMAAQIAALRTEVQRGQETIESRDSSLENERRELATVYYVIGTKRELIRDGIIVTEGGLLGVGRSLRVSAHLSDTCFTALDTDRDQTIPIPGQRAMVLSSQPAGSYALVPDGARLRLEIREPKEFREVRHVVIRLE